MSCKGTAGGRSVGPAASAGPHLDTGGALDAFRTKLALQVAVWAVVIVREESLNMGEVPGEVRQ